jgi:putative transposase
MENDCSQVEKQQCSSESPRTHCGNMPTVETLSWSDCQVDTVDMTCRPLSPCQTAPLQNGLQELGMSVTAESQLQGNKRSSKIKLNSCEATTQTTRSFGTSEAPSTGTERISCPFYDEHVKEISDKLWLPILTDCAERHSHWCAGSFRNTASNSWFTIQKWTPQKSNLQMSSSPHSLSSSADFMAGARTKIGLTEEEMAEEEKARRKAAALKRAEEKARKAEEKKQKAEEKALKCASKPPRKKTEAQLKKEAAKQRKQLENEKIRAENQAKRAARQAEKEQRPPPTPEQLEARRKAAAKKAEKKARAANASRTIRLRPTRQMRRVLKMWMGCYRVIYNRALDISKKTDAPDSYNYTGFIRAAVCNEENIEEEWLKNFPSACRKLAAKDLCDAFWSNQAKVAKTGREHNFDLKFKSKKDQNQTLKVESAHIVTHDNKVHICPQKAREEIKRICSEAGEPFDDRMLNMWFDHRHLGSGSIEKDVVITMDKLGRFWMHCPYKRKASPKNQGRAQRWASLDPGNRVFLTGYDPTGHAFKLGVRASDRIIRLSKRLDALVSRTDKLAAKVKRKRRKEGRNVKRPRRMEASRMKKIRRKVARMKKAQQRLRERVKNLVKELHWKCANWMCDEYTDIILPPFSTSEMVCKKSGRRLHSKVARGMMTMSHYSFRQRLLHVASMKGSNVHIRPEDYTSKTCTNCGFIHDGLGSKDVFKCPKCAMNACRDAAASRNIFLKNVLFFSEQRQEPCFHEHGTAR